MQKADTDLIKRNSNQAITMLKQRKSIRKTIIKTETIRNLKNKEQKSKKCKKRIH